MNRALKSSLPGASALLLTSLLLTSLLLTTGCSEQRYEFDAYEQILPRGKIAAITEPTYVSASAATIDDESYVLGLVVEGQARAYSLNLLNNHEVVNDTIGETPFAAIW